MKIIPCNLRKRNGIAIELAIVFVIVVFALCAVLTTISLSTRIRDRNITHQSTEYFVLDQVGEFFIKAVEKMGAGNDNLSEAYYNSIVSEVATEQQSTEMDKLAKYIKDINDDYEIQVFQSVSPEDSDTHRFSMKIWNKNLYNKAEAKAAGSGVNTTPELIVSVDRKVDGRNVTYSIRNWSNQENRLSYKEATEKVDRSSNWSWLLALLLVMVAVVVICVICII